MLVIVFLMFLTKHPQYSTIVVADHVSSIQANSLEFHVQFGPPAMQLGPENPPKRTDISGRPFFAETQISDDNHTDQLSNITSHHQLTNSFHGKDKFQKRNSIQMISQMLNTNSKYYNPKFFLITFDFGIHFKKENFFFLLLFFCDPIQFV